MKFHQVPYAQCQRLSKIVKDCQRLSKIVQDCPRLSKIVKDCQRLSKIAKDCQRLSKLVKDCQRPCGGTINTVAKFSQCSMPHLQRVVHNKSLLEHAPIRRSAGFQFCNCFHRLLPIDHLSAKRPKNTRTKFVMELSSPRTLHPASPGTLADTFSGVTVPMYLSIVLRCS